MSLGTRAGGGVVVGLVLVAILSAVPAGAVEPTCPGRDGTVPGSASSITMIGAGGSQPYLTIYIDDRDAFDLDDDGEAGGIWIYIESNDRPGLTRGADWFGYEYLDALPPVHVDPIPVLPPDPDRPVYPHGLTLFPGGMTGTPVHQLGGYDGCAEYDADGSRIPPDTLLF